MTDRDALTTGTRPTFDADGRPLYVPTQASHDAYLDYLIEHDPREAARRAVLLRPGDDAARLMWSEELIRGAGDRVCDQCEIGKRNPKWGLYVGKEGRLEYDDVRRSCLACRGTGRVPDGSAALGEMIRAGVELARNPERVRLPSTDAIPQVELRSAGPDCWVFTDAFDVSGLKVGDRVDVMGRGIRSKAKLYHGLIVRRITDRGSDGIEYVVVRDAGSGPWAGKEPLERYRALLPVVRAAGWFDLEEGETGRIVRPDAGENGGLRWVMYTGDTSHIVTATLSRGLPAKITCSAAAWLAVAGAVCERFPIETVEITNVEPWRDEPNGGFYFPIYHDATGLPETLWSFVAAGTTPYRHAIIYPTRAAAVLALSAASLRLGRHRAGLPALTGAPTPRQPAPAPGGGS